MKKPLHCLRCKQDMVETKRKCSLRIQGMEYASENCCYQCKKCKQFALDEDQFDCLYEHLREISLRNWRAEQFEFAF